MRLFRAELLKLKRSRMMLAGVLLMLLCVLLTLFSTTAMDGTVWTYAFFGEQSVKNAATTIFPMCIALLAGYAISREQKDDALKNILTVPVSYRRLLAAKILACAPLALFLGLLLAAFTAAAALAAGYPGFSAGPALAQGAQTALVCLLLYVAVTPIVALCARLQNGHLIGAVVAFVYGYGGMFAAGDMRLANLYPITAALGLVRYRAYDPTVSWNAPLCALSLCLCAALAALLAFSASPAQPRQTAAKR